MIDYNSVMSLYQGARFFPVIGICGAAGAGKDTFGEILSDYLGYPTYALASPIKEAAAVMLGVSENYFYDRDLKEENIPGYDFSPRKVLQIMGTEFGRDMLQDDIWLIRADKQVEAMGALIVTDVRFNNEVKWVRDHGGLIIKVKRPDVQPVRAHPTERGVADEDCDIIIHNEGDLRDLRTIGHEVAAMIDKWEKGHDIVGGEGETFEGDGEGDIRASSFSFESSVGHTPIHSEYKPYRPEDQFDLPRFTSDHNS